MSDFDFQMRADPSQAVRAAQAVERALASVEAKNRAIEAASRNAFTGMAAAMEQEQRILERIRGPMERFKSDLAALDSLHRRNAISLAEYNAELARMNRQAGNPLGVGNAAQAASTIGLPGGGRPTPSGGGSGAGAAIAGYATAGAAIGAGKAVLDLASDYQNLENRLRTVAVSTNDVNRLMDVTRALANDTRGEWGATTETFVRLTNATKSLSLSQEHVLQLTGNISKAAQLSGATSSEAAATMLQLSQAFASGRLQGDEFRSVAEQMPIVLDFLAKQLHVTRGELKQMAADGKIAAGDVVAAFDSAAPEIEAAFAKMKPTIGQEWQRFKNDAQATAGQLVENLHVMDVLNGTLHQLAGAIGDVTAAIGPLSRAFSLLGDSGGVVGEVLSTTLSVMRKISPMNLAGTFLEYGEKGVKAALGLEKLATAFDNLKKRGIQMAAELDKGEDAMIFLKAAAGNLADGIENLGERMGRLLGPMGALPTMFERVFGDNMENWNERVREHAAALERAAASARRFREENREFIKIFEAAANPRGRTESKAPEDFYQTPYGEMSRAEFDAFQAGNEKLSHLFDEVPAQLRAVGSEAAEASANARQILVDLPKLAAARYEEWEQRATGAISGVDRAVKSIRGEVIDIGTTVQNELVSAFHTLNETIVDAATTGELSWGKMFSSIEKGLAKVALQALEMRLLLALGLGGGGGGAAIPGGLKIPGFAEGGSFTAGGSGGPDSQLVMFRMSPGERADFTPRGQRSRGGGEGGPPMIVNMYDERDILPSFRRRGGMGDRSVVNFMHRNPGLVRRANPR